MTSDEPDDAHQVPDLSEPLLTTKEFAQHLRVTERTIRRWRAEGRIQSIEIGRTVRFRFSDITPG